MSDHGGSHAYVRNNHPLEAWTFADAAARAAFTGYDPPIADDVGRIAFEAATVSYWRLTDDSPVTWVQIGGAATSLGELTYDSDDHQIEVGPVDPAAAGSLSVQKIPAGPGNSALDVANDYTSPTQPVGEYAVWAQATGANDTNTAIYAKATGADKNYALITDGGKAGFGVLNPEEAFEVAGNVKVNAGDLLLDDGSLVDGVDVSTLPALIAAAGAGSGDALTNPMTAAGDIIIGSGSTTTINLAVPAQGATASASSEQSGHEAASAIDGDDATYWRSNTSPVTSGNLVVAFDTPRTISAYRLVQNNGSSADYSGNYVIQSSPDNSTWTTRSVANNAQDSGVVAFTPATALYWRAHANAGNGGNWAIFTLELWGSPAVGTPVRLPVGSPTQVLTVDPVTNLPSWAVATGGPGGSGGLLPLDQRTLHATYGDHFETNTLDPKWTLRNQANANQGSDGTWQVINLAANTVNQYHFQSAPAGDFAVQMKYKFLSKIQSSFGPCIVDSSGNGVMATPNFYGGGGAQNLVLWTLSAYGLLGNIGVRTDNDDNVYPWFEYLTWWVELKKVGTAYSARMSRDGVVWCPVLNGSSAQSFTVNRIGFGMMQGVGMQASVDWFDVI